jgi:sporulation protein YlmC with PRC-barrel domain
MKHANPHMPPQIDLVRDVLDKQLIDRDGKRMGKVDGLVLAIDADGRPRVVRIECGFVVLAGRFARRLERIVRLIGQKFGVRKGRAMRIAWSKVKSVGIEVKVDLDAQDTDALAWENWLHRHVTRHLPSLRDLINGSKTDQN